MKFIVQPQTKVDGFTRTICTDLQSAINVAVELYKNSGVQPDIIRVSE